MSINLFKEGGWAVVMSVCVMPMSISCDEPKQLSLSPPPFQTSIIIHHHRFNHNFPSPRFQPP